ncbi:CHAD domain-containing protein [Streptomyces sp. NPDC088785]|uniref:CYTH and CHAD domain-containing protein n=1 Tax=Streptomyces sp. NPDC088785 TaxID=3365897 RepID=UPI003814D3E1
MAETKREIERKYDAPGPEFRLPDLRKVPGVADTDARGVVELDALYYDTPDQRLAAHGITLRRRTGGADAGWHLKLPVAKTDGARDEIRAPLQDTVPPELTRLVRAHLRDTALVPVVRLRSARDVTLLAAPDGTTLAEVSVDAVRAERADGAAATAWTEIEVELADDADPAVLDRVEKRLRKAGVDRSAASSKLARALAETGAGGPATAPAAGPVTAGDHVLARLRAQRDALLAHDPAVRRDLPDAVHQMRVAARRTRSAFKTYKKVLDPAVTAPVAEELKWLGAELGTDRDHEVLTGRITGRVDAVPATLLLGPVRARTKIWALHGVRDSRERTLGVLDSARYLALLDALDALLADPPLLPRASRAAPDVLARAALKDRDRLGARIAHALSLEPGTERDLALHDARKAAKRARYAGETARPALGKKAGRFAKRMKAVQSLLGDHQDSVVARDTLRQLAVQAHAAGESAFTWGLLYGEEHAAATAGERALPGVWGRAAGADLPAG